MAISELWIYPIKSCRGFSVEEVVLRPWGLENDHEFMLVDENGVMISQRQFPRLCLVSTEIVDYSLQVTIPGLGTFSIGLDDAPGKSRVAKIHDDYTIGFDVSAGMNRLFEEFLGIRCFLIRHVPKLHLRMHNSSGLGDIPCNFADGYPVLATTTASPRVR